MNHVPTTGKEEDNFDGYRGFLSSMFGFILDLPFGKFGAWNLKFGTCLQQAGLELGTWNLEPACSRQA